MKRSLAIAMAAAAVLAAAGCSATGTSGSAADASPATHATQALLRWHAWGAYTGPWPPAPGPMPQPYTRFPLPTHEGIKGYVTVGVPLHFNIPRQGFDCQLINDSSPDLPPGQYVLSFAYTAVNRGNQQLPAYAPQIWVTVDGQENVIGTQITGDAGSLMIWESDGSCQGGYINPGTSDTEFGFIGPFTKDQLKRMALYATWAAPNDNPDPATAVLHQQLAPVVALNVKESIHG